jgi:hypothetical protein
MRLWASRHRVPETGWLLLCWFCPSPPQLPRCSATLHFVIPTGAQRREGSAVSPSGAAKVSWANYFRVPFRHPQTADPSATPPRISCRGCWRWRTSCGFLYGKPHTWPCPALRGRKSGYAPVGMTKWRVALHLGSGGGGWTESTNTGPHTYPDCPVTLSINYQLKS